MKPQFILEEALACILGKYPDLDKSGFTGRKISCDINNLWDELNDIEYVVEWLHGIKKINLVNRRADSCSLMNYALIKKRPNISNGTIIAAALIAGFDVTRSNPYGYFNMSQKSLNCKIETW